MFLSFKCLNILTIIWFSITFSKKHYLIETNDTDTSTTTAASNIITEDDMPGEYVMYHCIMIHDHINISSVKY